MTYLRQEFSMMLPVLRAAPWPTLQRFDFMVRSRVVSDEDAVMYRTALTKHEPGAIAPYEGATPEC